MALIRCKKCNNPMSSRSKACPICGEPTIGESVATPAESVAQESSTPTSAPTPTPTQAPTPTPTPTPSPTPISALSEPNTPVAPKAEKPRTLHDILAERNAAQQSTLNDSFGAADEAKSGETTTPQSKEEGARRVAETIVPTAMGIMADSAKSDAEATNERYERLIEDYEYEAHRAHRAKKGLTALIVVLLLALCVAGYFSYRYIELNSRYPNLEQELQIANEARKLFEDENSMLMQNAEKLVEELEGLKDMNDTIGKKYEEAVVMLEQLQREKTYNYEQLNKYKREVETLKGIMKGYVKQIDSLNTINKDLVADNASMRREISSAQLRADVAEEKAQEAETKVRIGSVIQTGGVRMVPINDKDREVRIKRATRLRTDFELTANELAEPGEKEIYLCIYGPDGYVLASDPMILFMFEGDEMMASAMRKVDYENRSVPVSIYYNSGGLDSGTYKVEIYVDGRLSGVQETYIE